MRRTALLVSTALLTALLPARRRPGGATRPAPVPVDRFEGEVPFASPARRGHLHLGRRQRRPARAPADRKTATPPRAKRYSPAPTTSAATAASPTTSPRPSPPTTGPRTRASASGGTAGTTARRSTSRSRTAARTARPPSSGRPPSPTTSPAGTRSRSPSPTSSTGPTTSPSAASTRSSASPRCGATPSPSRPARHGQFAMDDVELYGRADQSLRASVTTDAAVYPVKEGGTADGQGHRRHHRLRPRSTTR